MKNILILISLLVGLFAQAHIEPGVHTGKTADGQVCEMTVGNTYFDKNVRHPLNERIDITVNGDAFTVQHPPVISVTNKSAFFDHDHFHGVLPTSTGAKALVIDMAHTDQFEGPVSFHLIIHAYKANSRQLLTCTLDPK